MSDIQKSLGDFARWERRCKLAKAGKYLPTSEELLLGSPFLGDSLAADLAAFSSRILRRRGSSLSPEIIERLETMTVQDIDPTGAEMVAIVQVLMGHLEDTEGPDPGYGFGILQRGRRLHDGGMVTRFRIYSFYLGATEFRDDFFGYTVSKLGRRGFQSTESDWHVWLALRQTVGLMRTWMMPGLGASPTDIADRGALTLAQIAKPIITGLQRLRGDLLPVAGEQGNNAEIPDGPQGAGVVVIRSIGAPATSNGARVVESFKDMIGKLVPFIAVPADPRKVRDSLLARFPYVAPLIDDILAQISPLDHVALRPLVLWGPPGCGKTEFATCLLRELGIPQATYNCGGVADSAIGGTARHWSTGQQSLPLDLIKRHKVANPGIILDEIEKAATGRHNGSLIDVLLGMLEPASARHYHDIYTMASVDISHVIWLATSNDVSRLPAPLRDRCRVVEFPQAGIDHLPLLAKSVLGEIRAERRSDGHWLPDLAPDEIMAIAQVWTDGSIRKLRRLVDGVLMAREKIMPIH